MAEKYNQLFNEFPPVSTQEWMEKVTADLKGADFNKKLVWKTNDGINVMPFYRAEDLEKLDHTNSLPGEFPFVRGNKKTSNEWLVRQNIIVNDVKESNEKALDILNKGVNSLGFVFKGCNEFTAADITALLKGICLEAVEINFVCCCKKLKFARLLADFIEKGNWEKATVFASANIDPLGSYLLKGKFADDSIAEIKTLIEETADLKKFRLITVAAKNYSNAGSSIVQELAFSLAQGAEYLNLLTEAGLGIDTVARKIKFDFAVSANYFMEIAKFRAARMLWAQIVKAYDPNCKCSCKMEAHAETGSWNKTLYDPYVNMLRTQTEAMSAALGGVESITVLPFNAIYEAPTTFSDRIARNQQLLLKEESHLDKIVDPSAGSYYIEELTVSIAEEAWKLFLEIQDKGGFIAAAKEGFIQKQVKEMAAKRDMNIATRRENLLGVNQFPNFTEKISSEIDASVFEAKDRTAEDAEIETLKPYRGAQAFEALRYQTDVYSKTNKRPMAYMLTIGNLAMRKARAQFACNFFAVAGYEVIDNNGFATVAEGVEAAKAAKADIVVLCSSDDEYAELAPAASELLKDDAIFVVAGSPACMDDLKAKGISNFIHVKSNLLDELKGYQIKLGIK
ncbi:MAG: methylmalonyl-CoA mutase small subunit [Prolixibacteraceae bacterium]|jgi:methylmalonyl-CoA mutase|nr:methylmalonyl-CoA mutase small subunit [Prolixibacteraceae bacterium]